MVARFLPSFRLVGDSKTFNTFRAFEDPSYDAQQPHHRHTWRDVGIFRCCYHDSFPQPSISYPSQHFQVRSVYSSSLTMCDGPDFFLCILSILFPPIGGMSQPTRHQHQDLDAHQFTVWIKRGICSADSLINIALCCLGYIPGLLHAWVCFLLLLEVL